MAKLAFMTTGLLHEPWGGPRMQGFEERTAATFAVAETSEGFIARSGYGAEDEKVWGVREAPAMFGREDYEARGADTLSLWQNLESVFAFAYNGTHGEALGHRREWFVHGPWPAYVAWWVDDGYTPSWHEACQRFEKLHREGPTPEAFDFKQPFGPDGQPTKVDRDVARRKATQFAERDQAMKDMNEVEMLISNYVAAWSEPEAAARQQLISSVWSEGGTYIDPTSQAAGRAGLDAMIAQFHNNNPGATFTVEGKPDHHHGHFRFFWTLHFANGTSVPGMDYGEITPDGKLARIVGFF